MGVQDGQDVSAGVTNPAFINKNIDDTTPSRLGLGSTASDQGPSITWVQQQLNSIVSFLGLALNGVYNLLPSWTNNYVGSSSDTVFSRVQALVALFSGSTGHAHSGTDGDGTPIVASNLADVPLKGYGLQATNYTSTAASSDDVTSLLTGRPVSTGATILGVVSTTPYNKTILRNSTTGDEIKDALGNVVYGRLSFASSVWTHSYFSLIAGTETAYTFLATTPIEWFFQQLYNPMSGAPTYDPGFVIPSANSTADVETATTTTQGKTQLATSAASVGSANAAGTANATVANADHVHQGVHSIVASATSLFGDITLAVAGLITVALTGNTITLGLVNPLTTIGDLLLAGASGAWGRLGIGSTGQVLTVTGATTVAWANAAGGGGGGSIFWVEISNIPTATYENGMLVYAYASAQAQVLNCCVRVPTSYQAGNPIKLKMPFYDADTTGTGLLQTIATLIRTGTDVITSTTNQRTSTNTAVTLGSGTAGKPQAVVFDLTDSSGNVNSVAVSAGDTLLVALTRGTDTGTGLIKAMTYDSEVTFS